MDDQVGVRRGVRVHQAMCARRTSCSAACQAATYPILPGTAAALNESSIGVGARLGTTFVILTRAMGEGAVAAPVHADLTSWLRAATAVAGLVAILGGVLVALLLGRHGSGGSVWDLQDERDPPTQDASLPQRSSSR